MKQSSDEELLKDHSAGVVIILELLQRNSKWKLEGGELWREHTKR